MIQPVKLSFTEEPRKLYIGRLPKGTTDELVEGLLRYCGDLKSWKRSKDASGEPKAFGFAEFDNLEAVFAVLKLLNNAALTVDGVTSRLLVKADEKTTTFLQGWVEIKKSEWIAKLEKLGVSVDLEDLEQKEALGEIQPYERELITDYDALSHKIEQLLENNRDSNNALAATHSNKNVSQTETAVIAESETTTQPASNVDPF